MSFSFKQLFKKDEEQAAPQRAGLQFGQQPAASGRPAPPADTEGLSAQDPFGQGAGVAPPQESPFAAAADAPSPFATDTPPQQDAFAPGLDLEPVAPPAQQAFGASSVSVENANKGFVPLSSLPQSNNLPNEAPESPFQLGGAEAPLGQNPFEAAPSQPVASPFESVGEPLAVAEPPASPFGFAPAQPAAAPVADVELPRAVALRDVPEHLLGFDPSQVPVEVTTTIPGALLADGVASGQISVGLSEIVAGAAEQYRPAFVNADPNLAVPLPFEEVASRLPAPSAPQVAQNSPFEAAAPALVEAAAPSPFEVSAPVAPNMGSPFEVGEPAPAAPTSPFGLAEEPPAEPAHPEEPPALPGNKARSSGGDFQSEAEMAAQAVKEDLPFMANASMSPFEVPLGAGSPSDEPSGFSFGEELEPSAEATPFESVPESGAELSPFGFSEEAKPAPDVASAFAPIHEEALRQEEAQRPQAQEPPFGEAFPTPVPPEDNTSPFAPALEAPEVAASPFPPEAAFPPAAEPAAAFPPAAEPAAAFPPAAEPAAAFPPAAEPAAAFPPAAEPAAAFPPAAEPAAAFPPAAEPAAAFPPAAEPAAAFPPAAEPAAAFPPAAEPAAPFPPAAEPEAPATNPIAFASPEPDSSDAFEAPFAAAPIAEPQAFSQQEAAPEEVPQAGAWPLAGIESLAPAPPAELQPLEALSPLSAQLDEEPAPAAGLAPVAAAPLSPFPTEAAEVAPEPVPEATPSPFAGGRFSAESSQSTLRALFMTEGQLDVHSVLRHCTEMPGVEECVAISADGSVCAASQEGGLAADGSQLFGSIRSLAATLGAAQGPLTIRSQSGLVSFFSAGSAGLGVRHGDDGFEPGVQERLSLVASELDALVS